MACLCIELLIYRNSVQKLAAHGVRMFLFVVDMFNPKSLCVVSKLENLFFHKTIENLFDAKSTWTLIEFYCSRYELHICRRFDIYTNHLWEMIFIRQFSSFNKSIHSYP